MVGDGATLVSKTFSSVAAATAYFTNNALDLGSLASGPLSGNTLSLTITTSITMTHSGQGFDAGYLIGDPPSSGSGSVSQFASALAGFGAGAGSGGVEATALGNPSTAVQLATPGIQAA